MSDKKHQLMGYPFAGDFIVRLRIRDENGGIVTPESGLVEIKVYVTTGTNQWGGPIKTRIGSIGQPMYQPIIDFVMTNALPPFYRPVRRDDLGTSGLICIGGINYELLSPKMRDKLAALDVRSIDKSYLDKQRQWLVIVAELNVQINELNQQLATMDPDSPGAATLRDLLAQKKAEKERYFHGLTTISEQDLMNPTLFFNGRYILRIKRIRLRELFGIERPQLFFRVLPLNTAETVASNGVFCRRYHPGTTYPSSSLYGWPLMSEVGVDPGDHEIWLHPYYLGMECGIHPSQFVFLDIDH